MGAPTDFVEPLQVVSYINGQSFGLHHDSGEVDDSGGVSFSAPRRIATVFVYLSTLKEDEGGETSFPLLPLKVSPQAGTAVVFSNVLPNGLPDPRAVHEVFCTPLRISRCPLLC